MCFKSRKGPGASDCFRAESYMRLKFCRKVVGKSGNTNATEISQRHFRDVRSAPIRWKVV